MEIAKIKAEITEQGLRTEVMGTGGDIIMCVAAIMGTLAEGIARDGKNKCDISEASAQVAALAFKRMIQLQAVGTSVHMDVETLKKILEARQ